MRNTARNIGNGHGQMPRGAYRFCIHAENRRSGIARLCILDYQCGHCAFDQWLEEMCEGKRDREGVRTSSPEHKLAIAA